MSTSYCKLTDSKGYTRRELPGETRWRVGETVAPQGEFDGPCGPGCLHLYGSPEEAVLYDPIHLGLGDEARLLRVEVDGEAHTDGLKYWVTSPVSVMEELSLPVIGVDVRVAWAICLTAHRSTRTWAIRWLSGEDRSARAAAEAAGAATLAAVEAVAAVRAVRAAAEAAWAERKAAEAEAAWAARAATLAAWGGAKVDAARAFSARSLAALDRARRILAGELPAESYDQEDA